MTVNLDQQTNTNAQVGVTATGPSDKEINFRRQEQMYQRMLAEKEARIAEIERSLKERESSKDDDDDSDGDSYVDNKKFNKKLQKFGQQTKQETETTIQTAVRQAIGEERRKQWLEKHSDFASVMQHAETFAERDPDTAETILQMPEGFERQKLVYNSIKMMGLDKPPKKEESIQDKINANQRSPYYIPNSMGSAPYATQSDFSESGQKQAYDKMQDLKKRLRL